ncbi:MAG: sigma-54-dependent Fis family transcriptional regulator [Candidatus Eisenbacteria sp.]|nr:sigma-54-dependent Fis family transcriptional regulator [Candidatus Eisenbacteria bacterium]
MKPRILIVDDEKNIRRTLAMILRGAGYAVREAASGEEALSLLAEAPSEVALLDIRLPGQDGIETLKQIRAQHSECGVIMISGHATVSAAVEATRLGAFDFLEKPLSRDRVLIAVRNVFQMTSLGEQVDRYRRDEAQRRVMVGTGPAIEALRGQVAKVAPTMATVLITGESGSGKELVARLIHEQSRRAGGPFIKVNCAAIPEELIETELFGCVRGAYTGADRSRDGKFLLADGGTLFLDEIGDMSLRVQSKVLRALQEKEIERVGDSHVVRIEVRVIAATNKDLQAEVAAGRFREDLFFRLHVVPLEVPPLAARREDIPRLAHHFLELYALENDLPRKSLAPETLALLETRAWPGNIRELQNLIERLAILGEGPTITADDVQRLDPRPPRARAAPGRGTRESRAATDDPTPSEAALTPEELRAAGGLVQARRDFERRCISACLERTGGNISQAAQWLGIERSNLHKKIQAYGLDPRATRATEAPDD